MRVADVRPDVASLCADYGQPWRAAILHSTDLWVDRIEHDGVCVRHGNPFRLLSKHVAYECGRAMRPPPHASPAALRASECERSLYALVAGDLEALLAAREVATWEDRLWARAYCAREAALDHALGCAWRPAQLASTRAVPQPGPRGGGGGDDADGGAARSHLVRTAGVAGMSVGGALDAALADARGDPALARRASSPFVRVQVALLRAAERRRVAAEARRAAGAGPRPFGAAAAAPAAAAAAAAAATDAERAVFVLLEELAGDAGARTLAFGAHCAMSPCGPRMRHMASSECAGAHYAMFVRAAWPDVAGDGECAARAEALLRRYTGALIEDGEVRMRVGRGRRREYPFACVWGGGGNVL